MAVKVLVADDDAMNREIMEAYLALGGYETILARDGETALELARAHRPHLIITDVRMPDMDGFELCQTLQQDEAMRHIPVVVLSGLSSAHDVEQAKLVGARAFVSRPFVAEALFKLIGDLTNGET